MWTVFVACFETDIDYYGNPVFVAFNEVNENECYFKCQENDKCNYWTYYDKRCHLKSKRENVQKLSGAVSGPKFCAHWIPGIFVLSWIEDPKLS